MKLAISMIQNSFAFFLLLFFVNVGCQTVETQKASEDSTVIQPSKSSANNQNIADEKLNFEHWSPAKRESMSSYYVLIGEREALERNFEKARRNYEAAYNLDPNPHTGLKLLELTAINDLQGALTFARKMTLLYPNDAKFIVFYGRILAATGDLKDAEKQLRIAEKKNPNDVEVKTALIQVLVGAKKHIEALPIAQQLVKIGSEFPESWLYLSKLYIADNKLTKALEASSRAYQMNPLDIEKIHFYAFVSDLVGKKQQAIDLYQDLLKLDPAEEGAIQKMIANFMFKDSLEVALGRLKTLEKENKENIEGVRFQKAIIYWAKKDYQSATQDLSAVIENFSELDKVNFMTAMSHELVGESDKAIELYGRFDSSSDLFLQAKYRTVQTLVRRGQKKLAIEELQAVISTYLGNTEDFYLLAAELYAKEGNFNEALKTLEAGSVKYPHRNDFHFLRAVYLEQSGNIVDCISVLKRVINIDPNHAAALNFLGYLFVEQGSNLKEAEELILKALKLKPDDGYYLDSYGWLLYKKKEYQKSLEILLKAEEKAPDESVILDHIGDSLVSLGEYERAKSYYDKALKAKGDEKLKRKVLEKYEKFQKKSGS